MKEKIIIESSKSGKKYKKWMLLAIALPLVLLILTAISAGIRDARIKSYEEKLEELGAYNDRSYYYSFSNYRGVYEGDENYEDFCKYKEKLEKLEGKEASSEINIIVFSSISGAGAFINIVYAIAYVLDKKTKMVVTDKRVYGCGVFGKRLDLPLDYISAVSKGPFKKICVASPSGKLICYGLMNRNEAYDCIIDLLIERNTVKKEEYEVSESE